MENLEENLEKYRQKFRGLKYRLKQKIPDNWKYYTETTIGLFLVIASLGSYLNDPAAIINGTAYLLAGIYTIPDLRFRIMYKINERPPKYSVPAIIIASLIIGGIFAPASLKTSVNSGFQTLNSDISVVSEKEYKVVTAEAKVKNAGDEPKNYSVALSVDAIVRNKTSIIIQKDETKEFKFQTKIMDSGEHTVTLYSSISPEAKKQDGTGFITSEEVEVPFYLNKENVKGVAEGYSEIPQKDLDNIQEIKITETVRGNNVTLVNKISNAYSQADLLKTATVNSFFVTKEMIQRFEGVNKVKVRTNADYWYTNGTKVETTVLETEAYRSDLENTRWSNMTTDIRFNYTLWFDEVRSYTIREDLCRDSSELQCSKGGMNR